MCRVASTSIILLLIKASLVTPCIRLSPNIEAKLASLASNAAAAAARLGTTPAPSTAVTTPSTTANIADIADPADNDQKLVFEARIGGLDENSVNTRSVLTKTTRGPTTSPFMYTNRYDFVAIEQVLLSPRLMRNFHECMMGRGPCTSEGSELKRIVPEALRSNCARCTEKQRVQAGKVLVYLLEHRPDWWKELLEKFDPDGRFRRQYEYEEDEEEEEKPQ